MADRTFWRDVRVHVTGGISLCGPSGRSRRVRSRLRRQSVSPRELILAFAFIGLPGGHRGAAASNRTKGMLCRRRGRTEASSQGVRRTPDSCMNKWTVTATFPVRCVGGALDSW